MSEENVNNNAAPDPVAGMLEFYDNWTKSWAKSMSDMIANERVAQTMAEQLEGSLEYWSLVKRQVGEVMEQYLQQMNLPTQRDVIGVAERLTSIEMRVDDIEAKVDEVLDRLKEMREE
ncbi:MAG: hypothetical protein ACK2T3_06680 [Candidatus Promineifilaceae bacterium]|jgi:polyhydroxyalkanoic acid synthase PhaR subunit